MSDVAEYWRDHNQWKRETKRVCKCKVWKGSYGFITDQDGNDYFVHESHLEGCNFLHEGAQVRCHIIDGSKGKEAIRVTLRRDIKCHKCNGIAHFARDCISK